MIQFDKHGAAYANRERIIATLNLMELALDMPRLYADQARKALRELKDDTSVFGVSHGLELFDTLNVAGCESPAAAPMTFRRLP